MDGASSSGGEEGSSSEGGDSSKEDDLLNYIHIYQHTMLAFQQIK